MPDGVQQKELESSLVERIKGSIVEYFNGHALLDCPFRKSPSSLPAPVGKYVAVRKGSTMGIIDMNNNTVVPFETTLEPVPIKFMRFSKFAVLFFSCFNAAHDFTFSLFCGVLRMQQMPKREVQLHKQHAFECRNTLIRH